MHRRWLRALALCVLVAFCLVISGLFVQPSYAMSDGGLYDSDGSYGAVAIAFASTLILAAGVRFNAVDYMRTAARNLLNAAATGLSYVVDGATVVCQKIGDAICHELAQGKVLFNPTTIKRSYKATISDSTWNAVRSWVQSKYPVGDITDGASIVAVTDFASKTYVLPVGDTYTRYYMSDTWWYSYRIHYAVDGVNSSFQVFTVSDNGSETAGTLYSRAQHLAPIISGTGSTASIHDTVGANIYVSTDFASTRYKVLVPGDVVGLALPGYVDNPDCDFHNSVSGNRDVSIPLDYPVAGEAPDVILDNGDGLVVDAGYDNGLLSAVPADVTNTDVTGVEVEASATEATDSTGLASKIWEAVSAGIGGLVKNIILPLFGWLYEMMVGLLEAFAGLWSGVGAFFGSLRGALSGFGSSFSTSPFNDLLRACLLLLPDAVKTSFLLLICVTVGFGLVRKL